MLGVDVDVCVHHFHIIYVMTDIHNMQDNYRIIMFEGPECLPGGVPLKSHLTLVDGYHRPGDRFLRLHFKRCLAVSACRGDVMEDYEEQEIENLMEELGVYDGEMDTTDPRWQTPLGVEVYSHLIRQKLAEYVLPFVFLIFII
jgi:hypothetical protein